MQIQHLNQNAVNTAVGQDFGDAGLGRVGNLAFRGQPGATPRAEKPGLLQSFANRVSAKVSAVMASPSQRAQQKVVEAARSASARAGDLLGSLTAPAQDGQAARRTASALSRLADGASGLPGGQASVKAMLARHVGRLDALDVKALASGPLADPAQREATLAQLEPGQRRTATALFATVDRLVGERLVHDVMGEPMNALSGAAQPPVDVEAVEAALGNLAAAMDRGQALSMFGHGLEAGETVLLPASVRAALSSEPAQLAVVLSSLADGAIGQLREVLDGMAPADAQHASLRGVLQEALDAEAGRRMDKLGERLARGLLQAATAGASVERLHGQMLGALQSLADDLRQGDAMPVLHRLLKEAPPALREHYLAGLSAETRAAMAQPLHDVLAERAQAVTDALQAGRGDAAAAALLTLVDAFEGVQSYHKMIGEPTPAAAPAAVRQAVLGFMAGDPSLGRADFAGLSDNGFGLLVTAEQILDTHGLVLDRAAVKQEVAARSAHAAMAVGRQVDALVAGLDRGTLDGPGMVIALRDAAGRMMERLDALSTLGHEVGSDDRINEADRTVQTALAKLDGEALDRVRQAWAGHAPVMMMALQEMKMGLSKALMRDDGDPALTRQTAQIDMAANLAAALHPELLATLQAPAGIAPETLAALSGQFGVDYDPASGDAAPMMSAAAREDFTRELTRTPDPAVHRPVTHRTGTQDVVMSPAFHVDAVQRVGVSFSVSGIDAQGNRVQERSLVPGMDDALRPAALDNALDALVAVAGPAAENLTRVVNQQIAGGLAQALMRNPVPLADGAGFMPGGGGYVHGDIQKRADGTFDVAMLVEYNLADVGFQKLADGNLEPAAMDGQASHVRARFTLRISADGARIQMQQPVQLQHHLVPAG